MLLPLLFKVATEFTLLSDYLYKELKEIMSLAEIGHLQIIAMILLLLVQFTYFFLNQSKSVKIKKTI